MRLYRCAPWTVSHSSYSSSTSSPSCEPPASSTPTPSSTPPRIWLLRRFGPESALAYFISCPWCVSIWIAGISAPFVLWALDLPLWLWPLLGLAASHLTGLAAQLDSDDLEIEIEDE